MIIHRKKSTIVCVLLLVYMYNIHIYNMCICGMCVGESNVYGATEVHIPTVDSVLKLGQFVRQLRSQAHSGPPTVTADS